MSKLANVFEETLFAIYEQYGQMPAKLIDGIGEYMEERLAHMRSALDEDMFDVTEEDLVSVEKHNVSIKLGIALSRSSKAIDHAVAAAIFGMLRTAL